MITKIVREWEVTATITRTLKYPIEDNESKEDIIKWANSVEGKRYIQQGVIKNLNCFSYPRNADIEVSEVELKETEVKSTDIDPRV